MKKILRLSHIGEDGWGRQVYKDANGKLWKDTDNRIGWLKELYTAAGNDFEGEPDIPMKKGIECIFIPERIVRS